MAHTPDINMIKQAAWATPITPTKSFAVIAPVERVRNPGLAGSARVQVNTGENEMRQVAPNFWQITLKGEIDATNFTFFLESILGNVSTAADTPVASSYTHTYKLTGTQAELDQLFEKGYTLEYGQDGRWYTAGSCVTTSIVIDPVTTAGVPTVTITVLARTNTEATTAAGTFSVKSPSHVMDTSQLVVSYGVNASEVAQDFTGFGLSIVRNDISPFNTLNDQVGCKKWKYGATTTISGSFKIETDDTNRAAVKDDLDNLDTASMLMAFTSKEFVTGTTNYSLTFDMATVQLTNMTSENDQQLEFDEFAFVASIGAGTPTDVCIVTAINGETAAY